MINTLPLAEDTPVLMLPTSKTPAIKKLHMMIGSTCIDEYLHQPSSTQERVEKHGTKKNIHNDTPQLSSSNDKDNKPPVPQKDIKQATPSLVWSHANLISTLQKNIATPFPHPSKPLFKIE
jgi:hypothetical protein